MAFDWTKVEGYREGMTPEEMIALLANFNMPEPAAGTIAKSRFDKVASELAAAKKQLEERMSEDERKEADRLAAETAMKEELEALRRERTLEKFKSSFMAQKYDAESAEAMAKALADNDTDNLFKVLAKANEDAEKAAKAEWMKGTPTPPIGGKANEDDSKTDAVKLAERLSAVDATNAKVVNDGLSYYM